MYWITGILGLVLAVAPFIFGYSDNTAALWTSLFIGVGTMATSVIEGLQNDQKNWEYWTVGVLGLLAITAPFMLGFSGQTNARWTSVVVGLLIAVFAGTRLTAGQQRKI